MKPTTNLERSREIGKLKKVNCLKVMNGTGEKMLVSGTVLKFQLFRSFVSNVSDQRNIEKEISIFLF